MTTSLHFVVDRILADLVDTIVTNIHLLYMISEAVAQVDFLCALGAYAMRRETGMCVHLVVTIVGHHLAPDAKVRPEFTNVLAIKDGRHPILDSIPGLPVTPNPTYCADGLHFQILSGHNHSGKSTYLQQIALLQIMVCWPSSTKLYMQGAILMSMS